MPETRHWVPPCLCGCELAITADWSSPLPPTGKMYQHPMQWTITDIQVVSACPDHADLPMPDTRIFFQKDDNPNALDNLRSTQCRGYLKYPIANPTPGEILYTNLYAESGNTRHIECGCKVHHHFNRYGGDITPLEHPVHSVKCEYHPDDDVAGTQASLEEAARKETIAQIKSDCPELEMWRPVGTDDDAWQPISTLDDATLLQSYLSEKKGDGPTFETQWLFIAEYDNSRQLQVVTHPAAPDVDIASAVSKVADKTGFTKMRLG